MANMTPPRGAIYDVLHEHGLPATLDGLSAVCRMHAEWCRQDGERKEAAKFGRVADALHKLSLGCAP
jgi:hypothetical protein